jgi:hypothetical protein
MSGLKTYLPRLGQVLGISPSALYERQRVLVRLGLLAADKGRGPGSGVRMTGESLAALLLAVAVTDNLSDTDQRVSLLCDAKPRYGKQQCRFTKQGSLRAAMAKILSTEEMARRTKLLSVNRSKLTVSILYRTGMRSSVSQFSVNEEQASAFPLIYTETTLSEDLFKIVARDLGEIERSSTSSATQ